MRKNNFFFFILFTLILLFFDLAAAQGEFVYDSKGDRDPFLSLITPDGRLLQFDQQEKDTDLLLEGIIYHPDGESYAIVNQEIVKVKDRIGKSIVYKIEKDKVIFLKGDKYIELKLEKEDEK